MEEDFESRVNIWFSNLQRKDGPMVLLQLCSCLAVANLWLYNRGNMWNTLHFMIEQRAARHA